MVREAEDSLDVVEVVRCVIVGHVLLNVGCHLADEGIVNRIVVRGHCVMKSLCKRCFRARMVSLAVRVSQGLCPDMSHDKTNFTLMDIFL